MSMTLARRRGPARNDGGVVAEMAVAVQFAELAADHVDVIIEQGPLGVPGDLHGFPGGEVFIGFAEQRGVIGTKLAKLFRIVDLLLADCIASSSITCCSSCASGFSKSSILRAIAPAVGDALLTDVGSTKRTVVELSTKLLPHPGRFVGSHPMAGSEKRGIEFARADLCEGATCIVTPTDGTDPKATAYIEALWKKLGMNTLRMSPADHDRRVAQISHLPHALAAILVASADDDALDLAGKGFRDVTRIAGGDGALWRDILIDNRDNMRECIARLKAELDKFEGLLEPDQGEALRAFLDEAGTRRSQLSKANESG
jgi:prephenate dehydrogenase